MSEAPGADVVDRRNEIVHDVGDHRAASSSGVEDRAPQNSGADSSPAVTPLSRRLHRLAEAAASLVATGSLPAPGGPPGQAALTSEAMPMAPSPPPLPRRRAAFNVAPAVIVAEQASTRTTVVEVNARDREGLLARLALAIHGEGLQVRSAHIATYGERAVDVFYLTRGDGRKLSAADVESLREALLKAAGDADAKSRAT